MYHPEYGYGGSDGYGYGGDGEGENQDWYNKEPSDKQLKYHFQLHCRLRRRRDTYEEPQSMGDAHDEIEEMLAKLGNPKY